MNYEHTDSYQNDKDMSNFTGLRELPSSGSGSQSLCWISTGYISANLLEYFEYNNNNDIYLKSNIQ